MKARGPESPLHRLKGLEGLQIQACWGTWQRVAWEQEGTGNHIIPVAHLRRIQQL